MKTFENKILGSYQKLVVSKLIEVAKNMPNTPHIKPKAIDINWNKRKLYHAESCTN